MITVTPVGRSPDDAANINKALASVSSGIVMLGAGNFVLASTDQIVWPANRAGLSLVGEGGEASQLLFDARATDGMVVPISGDCCMRDLGFVGQGATSGALLRLTDAHNFVMDRVIVRGSYWDGIAIDGGADEFIYTLTNIDVDATPGTGYRAIVVGENALVQDLYLTTCKTAQTEYGIWLANVSGFYELNCQCYAHRQHGLLTYPVGAQVCQWFQCTGHLSDSCGGTGVYLGSAGGTVRGMTFGNIWSSSNNIGVEIWSGASDLEFPGRRILANKQQALINYGATDVHWWPGPP